MANSTESKYFFENLMGWFLKNSPSSFSRFSTLYVGLLTDMTNYLTVNPATFTEVTGGSYARVAIADTNWTGPASDSSFANTAALAFPAPTANWGTVIGAAIFDASTAGNLLFYMPLLSPKLINNGDTAPRFEAGQLRILHL
jgi:hypothetical protein